MWGVGGCFVPPLCCTPREYKYLISRLVCQPGVSLPSFDTASAGTGSRPRTTRRIRDSVAARLSQVRAGRLGYEGDEQTAPPPGRVRHRRKDIRGVVADTGRNWQIAQPPSITRSQSME